MDERTSQYRRNTPDTQLGDAQQERAFLGIALEFLGIALEVPRP